jgi:hypothetical protein
MIMFPTEKIECPHCKRKVNFLIRYMGRVNICLKCLRPDLKLEQEG